MTHDMDRLRAPVRSVLYVIVWLMLVHLSLAGSVLAVTDHIVDTTRIQREPNPPRAGQSGPAQQLTHDVAVTEIQGSLTSVAQGETVKIDVTVANLGTVQETLSVNLWDDTDAREIDAIFVTLTPGQLLTIGFQWITANASAGPHTVTATATTASDQDVSSDSLSIASPIDVMPVGITLGDENGSMQPKDSFGSGLLQPAVNTLAVPRADVFIGNDDAHFSGGLALVAVSTQPAGRQSFFVANAGATFQPTTSLRDPFLQGEVRGLVHVEGRQSSLGGYVQVRGDTHQLSPSGDFAFLAPDGTFDIVAAAPGHLSAIIPGARINSTQVLTIPELTLPFGDANGDGKIDIMDLSMAASNFGRTTEVVTPPP